MPLSGSLDRVKRLPGVAFGLSPYFRIVKPTIEAGFDYKAINWGSAVLGADGMLPDGNSHDTPTP